MMPPYKRLLDGIKSIFKLTTPIEELPVEVTLAVPKLTYPSPVRIPRSAHQLSRQSISKSALKVLYQLQEAGYQAYLVGGGVRDVLLGHSPKDFDVVTNAHPEQIRGLFRHCRLIGRRFLLAHVCFGKEIIEVATFRARHDESGEGVMQDGRILRDNVYGTTVEEDAWRRDFTINALYYDISDYSLVDFANGMADLRAGVIRLIGDPIQRYQEDPVRMLRAVRFAAKLGFTIDTLSANPIYQLGKLLIDVHSARLYEEVLKLFLTGHAQQSFEQLCRYDLFTVLFPQTAACLDSPIAKTMIEQALHSTDERVIHNQPVTPSFLFAALLWPPLLQLYQRYLADGLHEQEGLMQAIHQVLAQQIHQLAIPKRITVLLQEIWMMQPRLTRGKRTKKRSFGILQHPRFRASYDFLLLRATAGESEVTQEAAQWWTQFQSVDADTQQSLFVEVKSQRRKRRHPRKAKKPAMNKKI